MKIKNKTKFNKAIKQTVKLFLNQKNGKFYQIKLTKEAIILNRAINIK